MNSQTKVCCFVFVISSTLSFGTDNINTTSEQNTLSEIPTNEKTPDSKSMISNMFSIFLGNKIPNFLKKHSLETMELECSNCKKRISIDEFSGNMNGAALLFIAKDFDHNENIKEELEEFVELLKNGTPSEVEDFMILIANKIRINAGLCDHVCWTKVTETTE
jgi:hypothetical protein